MTKKYIVGTYLTSIDNKNRILIPADLRKLFSPEEMRYVIAEGSDEDEIVRIYFQETLPYRAEDYLNMSEDDERRLEFFANKTISFIDQTGRARVNQLDYNNLTNRLQCSQGENLRIELKGNGDCLRIDKGRTTKINSTPGRPSKKTND